MDSGQPCMCSNSGSVTLSVWLWVKYLLGDANNGMSLKLWWLMGVAIMVTVVLFVIGIGLGGKYEFDFGDTL